MAVARADETRAEGERRRLEFDSQAEQACRLYLARYREMAAAYPQVLVAQRTLFQMTAEYFDNLEGAWRAGLRLQGFLVGEGLEAPDRVGDELGVAIEISPGGER